ncbi:AAA family ATPase [Clavibacter michiganensis]|uniref:MinD/ParA family ATP-binding protein n=1 Tax=Clavibacter michiganensis TaxID=28447 RepID=UPI001365EFB6|nr:AAA family ATPase [Clavibacter michiganensis]MDO4040067.1 AAA family ATPase [Clavibacter michiganensis]MDO4059258.1 AAA family ATPase [Clavibacter michiganensis]MDO4077268.1 AAA family ATPase [Clavibacter michiganensis]MDO4092437.1 AAA family ATPase [Clavibacter michiganensis]MDO4101610.1 AAA family ATPase [Clavibacter michiganensis]
MTDAPTVPAFPRIDATITPTMGGRATGVLTVNGVATPFAEASEDDIRRGIVTSVRGIAEQMQRAVRLTTRDRFGSQALAVGPDGTVEALSELDRTDAIAEPAVVPPSAAAHGGAAAPIAPAAAVAAVPAVSPAVGAPAPTMPSTVAPAPAAVADPPLTRRAARQSFLTREEVEEPATQGMRGTLTRLGIRMSPSEAERLEREWTRLVSQHWPGPRTVAVVNGKGGVGKTMTTICLSSVFARHGGAGVLAWDNNQTRGTLGWSTEQGPHDASILDLLPQVDRLLGTGAQSADLAHFVHHQTRDRYDVLRSKPEVLATQQRFDDTTVDLIHAVAAKFYRLVLIDSGNDETDPMWLRAIERADQIVVPTIGEAKAAESAALLIEGLAERGGHFADLAERAVVVVSAHKHDLAPAELAKISDGFAPLARDVVTVPYDPALGADVLNYGALRASTQRAWLRAGAAVARGL